MNWARHIVCMGAKQNSFKVVLIVSLKERDHLEDLGMDGRIILK